MDWSSFLGALAGTVVGTVIIFGIIALWMYVTDRRAEQNQQTKQQPITFDNILESQIESFIIDNFATLFPGWKIFDEPDRSNLGVNVKPSGIQYHTNAGRIDILAIDSQDSLVAIELKKDKAPDKVVSQVDRYVTWIKAHLAKPGQKVRGLIIAKSADDRLVYSLSRRRGITIWRYEWQLKLNKKPDWKIVITRPNHHDDAFSENMGSDFLEGSE